MNINMMKQQRRFKDIDIEGMTARWYDNNTRKSRLTEMKEYAKEASKYLHHGCSVLEAASGPGYLAIELAKLDICNKIIGLDISKDFVEIAQRNAKKADVSEVVEFQHGNIADIHFPDNTFDFSTGWWNSCIRDLGAVKSDLGAVKSDLGALNGGTGGGGSIGGGGGGGRH